MRAPDLIIKHPCLWRGWRLGEKSEMERETVEEIFSPSEGLVGFFCILVGFFTQPNHLPGCNSWVQNLRVLMMSGECFGSPSALLFFFLNPDEVTGNM